MPVTRISVWVDCSTKGGAGAWIGAVALASTGPRSSTGSPMTLRMRPSGSPPVGAVHRDRADGRLAELLRHLEHEAAALHVGRERVQDRRQRLLVLEVHVD